MGCIASMNKYLKWGIIVFELILIISLVQGIGKTKKSRTRVDKMVVDKNKLVEERRELLGRLEYVQGKDYIEKIAREELSLAKEGEVVVIVPDDGIQQMAYSKQQDKDGEEVKQNWKKWLAVFGVE